MLRLMLDQNDSDRAYVKFQKGDKIILLVNNMGGQSTLEMNATVHETVSQLERDWHIKPIRIYEGAFVTSMNMPGVSLTLLNLTSTASEASTSDDQLVAFLDFTHGALAWPGSVLYPADERLAKRTLAEKCVDEPPKEVQNNSEDVASATLQGRPVSKIWATHTRADTVAWYSGSQAITECPYFRGSASV